MQQLPVSGTSERKAKRKRFLEQSHNGGGPSANGNGFPRDGPAGGSAPEQPVAGPSKQVGTFVSEGVVFIEPPNNGPLLRELRGMVAGLNPLNQSKRL